MSRFARFVLCVLMLSACGEGGDGRTPSELALPVSTPVAQTVDEPIGRETSAQPRGDTLAGQLATLPSWATSVEPEPMRMDGQPSTVPQVRDAGRLLDTLRVSSTGEGTLLCRVSVAQDRDWDSPGLFRRNVAPDPSVYLRVGEGEEVRARLPEDTYEGVASVPGVRLEVGTALAIRVVDRDVAVDDPVGDVTLVWASGEPLVGTSGPLTLRCAMLPGERSRALAREALDAAERLLAPAERAAPRFDLLRHPDARLVPELERMRTLVRDAASFVGYGDPAVWSLVERVDALARRAQEAFDAAIARELARLRAGESVRVGPNALASITGFACAEGELGTRCTLRLGAVYERIPSPPGFTGPVDATLIVPGVGSRRCMHVDVVEAGFVRTPGEKSHTLECTVLGEVPEGPALIQLRHGLATALTRT